MVRSISNGRKYKIRQRISCKSKNIVHVVTCKKCKLQGVGHSTEIHKRMRTVSTISSPI